VHAKQDSLFRWYPKWHYMCKSIGINCLATMGMVDTTIRLCSHAFVIMPNNVHGILEIINEKTYVDELNDNVRNNNNVHGNTNVRGNNHVGTGRDLSLPLDAHQHIFNQKNTPQKIKIKSLSELIGAYKTTTSKLIHHIPFPHFAWQRSFHDHIIQNDKALRNIHNYIINNPKHWNEDIFYKP